MLNLQVELVQPGGSVIGLDPGWRFEHRICITYLVPIRCHWVFLWAGALRRRKDKKVGPVAEKFLSRFP